MNKLMDEDIEKIVNQIDKKQGKRFDEFEKNLGKNLWDCLCKYVGEGIMKKVMWGVIIFFIFITVNINSIINYFKG